MCHVDQDTVSGEAEKIQSICELPDAYGQLLRGSTWMDPCQF